MLTKRWIIWAAVLTVACAGYAFLAGHAFVPLVRAGLPVALASAMVMWLCVAADPDQISTPHWAAWPGIMVSGGLVYGLEVFDSPFALFTIWNYDVAIISAFVWYYVAPKLKEKFHA
ncbi:MAG: hypothetical protein WAZ27_04920 [Minisyncoccia bacterium]